MKQYELTYLLPPKLSEQELTNLSTEISSFITEEQGIIKEKSEPVRKKLASPIKKQGEAFLGTLNFHLNPEKIKNLEKKLKEENNILRFTIIKKKEFKKMPRTKKILKPSIIAERKSPKSIEEKKVELKEIDKKIEEILNE